MTPKELEETLKHFLQRNVAFRTKTKTIKRGKLILFNIVDYYILFTVRTAFSNKLQTYEVPFPFKAYKQSDGKLILDYQFKHIYNNDIEIKEAMEEEKDGCKSKYLDTTIVLEEVYEV